MACGIPTFSRFHIPCEQRPCFALSRGLLFIFYLQTFNALKFIFISYQPYIYIWMCGNAFRSWYSVRSLDPLSGCCLSSAHARVQECVPQKSLALQWLISPSLLSLSMLAAAFDGPRKFSFHSFVHKPHTKLSSCPARWLLSFRWVIVAWLPALCSSFILIYFCFQFN